MNTTTTDMMHQPALKFILTRDPVNNELLFNGLHDGEATIAELKVLLEEHSKLIAQRGIKPQKIIFFASSFSPEVQAELGKHNIIPARYGKIKPHFDKLGWKPESGERWAISKKN